MANHLWGGVLASLDICHNKMTFLSCVLSHFCSSKLCNLLLPSLCVPELGAVCYSDGLMHLLNFVDFEPVLFSFKFTLASPGGS